MLFHCGTEGSAPPKRGEFDHETNPLRRPCGGAAAGPCRLRRRTCVSQGRQRSGCFHHGPDGRGGPGAGGPFHHPARRCFCGRHRHRKRPLPDCHGRAAGLSGRHFQQLGVLSQKRRAAPRVLCSDNGHCPKRHRRF